MSLYADYIKERTCDEIIESANGFVTYRYLNNGDTVYIVDIYVVPEERRKGYARTLADFVAKAAKEKGAKEMWGTVAPSKKGGNESLEVLIRYGMTLISSSDDVILFRKDI